MSEYKLSETMYKFVETTSKIGKLERLIETAERQYSHHISLLKSRADLHDAEMSFKMYSEIEVQKNDLKDSRELLTQLKETITEYFLAMKGKVSEIVFEHRDDHQTMRLLFKWDSDLSFEQF